MNGVIKPELTEAIGKIAAASKKAGKKCGVFATSGEQAKKLAAQGFDMINVGTDHTTLEFTLKEQVNVAKGTTGPAKDGY